jgi:phosphoglycolate phosphatase-like HAD superfamily hydrolase
MEKKQMLKLRDTESAQNAMVLAVLTLTLYKPAKVAKAEE